MTAPEHLTLAGEFATPTRDEWLALVDKVLKGAPFDKKLVHTTDDGIAVQPLYTPADATEDPGLPGFHPFTRGSRAAGPAGGSGVWDIRQVHAHPDPVEANRQVLADLEGGVTSLLIRFDDSFRHGVSPAEPAFDELGGHGGVLIDHPDDLDRVLADVYLDLAPVALDAGVSFLAGALCLVELWERRGISDTQALGAFRADPLGALADTGELPQGLDQALAHLAWLARTTAERWPNVTSVGVDTAPYVAAGASDAQELAAFLATGVAYLRSLHDSGLDVAAAAGQVEVTLHATTDFFGSIAKLRAARRVWARVLEASGVPEEQRGLRLHVGTAARVLTRRDPWVNLLRTTVAAFAAGVGGADSVTVLPFDATIGPADDLARRVARNTHVVLQEESNVARVLDPAGGSSYIESLTDSLARAAWDRFQAIEAAGGMASVLTDGSFAEDLAATALARRTRVATRREPITGVSEFPLLTEAPVVRPEPDLDALRAAARSEGAHTFELPAGGLPAVEAGPTRIPPLPRERVAQPFEDLRDASDAHLAATGTRPRVFVASVGPVAAFTARATFARNLFEAGGVEAVGIEGFDDGDSAAKAFAASGTSIAVICSSDPVYAELAEPVATALKAAGAARVYLAGAPGEHEEAWRSAGVDEFVHVGVDLLDVLARAHQVLGVSA